MIALRPIRPIAFMIAGAGDADDERGEQQRRDDHLDHAQERVGERLHLLGEAGDVHAVGVGRRPEIADHDAEDEAGENLRRVGGGTERARVVMASRSPGTRCRTNWPIADTTASC